MNRRQFLKLAATAAAGSALAACGATPTATPSPVPPTATKPPAAATAASVAPTATAAPAAAGGTPVRGGTLRLVCESPATALDQMLGTAAGDGLSFAGLYDTLMFWDASNTPRPELATSYEVSPDGLTHTFKLRQGVKFHDGTTLDADAVKFSVDRLHDPKQAANWAATLSGVTDVKVVDPQTVSFVLKAPNVAFQQIIIAVYIVSPTAVQKLGADFRLKPVGSGPFKIASWTPGDKVVLDRWDGYWKQGSDGKALPYFDHVEISALSDSAVRQLNMRSGQFDYNTRNDPKDVASIKSDPNMAFIQTPTGVAYSFVQNSALPPFDKKAMRQAAAAAIDADSLIKAISYGTGYYTPWRLGKNHWLFPYLPQTPLFDKNLAKQKLAEAGYPNGVDVTLSIINRSPDDQIALIVKDNLDAIGIRTTIEALERTTWIDKTNAGKHQLALLQAGTSGADPDRIESDFNWTIPVGQWGLTAGAIADKMAELASKGRSVNDRAQRATYYKQYVDLMRDEAFRVYFGNVPGHIYGQRQAEGLRARRFGELALHRGLVGQVGAQYRTAPMW